MLGNQSYRAALAAALLVSAASYAQDGPFTLEQILSAPFPSGMTAAPEKARVAWVFYEQGARNVWAAGGPGLQARRLTQWDSDDAQTIHSLNWTPDAQHIVFARGDGPNRAGELPNPLHRPQGVEQAIWIVPFQGGEARKLAEGSSPAVSPRGGGTAFMKAGKVWWVDFEAEEGEELEPRLLFEARGGIGSLTWSPDGARLAFTSSRGSHGYIGIFNLDDEAIAFISPSVDRDVSPTFSPDGDRLAFIRIPASSGEFAFKPRREATPWSIHVHDFDGLQTRLAWRAPPGAGSAFQPFSADSQILWSSDDRLVFAWEREGWKHLYSVPASGGEARQLTPGEFEVEHVALDSGGRHVVYSSNQDDIDRRHLWRVAATGGPVVALTRGASNEWSPAPLSDGTIAFLRSSGTEPAQPAALVDGQTRLLAANSLPEEFPEQHLVEPQQVIFSGADGMRIHGQLFLPGGGGQKRPAMLFFHGGSRRQMLLGFHYMRYYHNCYAFNQYLASQGYVVLSVNYRSGVGYGMHFREAENYGAAGASEFNDVLGAGLYLRSRDDVDPERIGLWGGSYGGYLTALGLARASDLFAAGVDIHGVHDWNVVIKNFVPSYDTLRKPEAARLAYESSPMASIDTWRSPVLIIHGDDDRNVPFSESVDLAEALRKRNVHFEQLILPDEVHGFLTHRAWLKAFQHAADFLERHLGD